MAVQMGKYLATLVFFLPIALLFFVVARYHRLRYIPGPLLPAFTDIHYQWRLRRGESYVDIIHRLHEKYGPVVRWGPNRVSFASTSAIPLVYGTKDVFPKVCSSSCIYYTTSVYQVEESILVHGRRINKTRVFPFFKPLLTNTKHNHRPPPTNQWSCSPKAERLLPSSPSATNSA